MLTLLIPDEEQGAFPGGGSSTADISPSNLRKALPVGYEEREREMDCSAVCSVLTGSQIVDSPLGKQDSLPELHVHRPEKGI